MHICIQQKSETTKITSQKIDEITIKSSKDQIGVHKSVEGKYMVLLISENRGIQD